MNTLKKMFYSKIHRMPHLIPKPLSSTHTINHFIEAMRRHDPRLIEHGERTAIYTLLLGRILNVPDVDLLGFCHAALLHDLGKLTLPNEVIHANGISIIGEYLMTECTPAAGAEILRAWPDLQEISKLIALHHEHWDGSGNPFGMRGTFIPLGARILSLADTVDQLLSQKDDRIPTQISALNRVLRALAATRLDPNLVEIFIREVSPRLRIFFLSLPSPLLCQTQRKLQTFRERGSTNRLNIDPLLKRILDLTNPVSIESTVKTLVR